MLRVLILEARISLSWFSHSLFDIISRPPEADYQCQNYIILMGAATKYTFHKAGECRSVYFSKSILDAISSLNIYKSLHAYENIWCIITTDKWGRFTKKFQGRPHYSFLFTSPHDAPKYRHRRASTGIPVHLPGIIEVIDKSSHFDLYNIRWGETS